MYARVHACGRRQRLEEELQVHVSCSTWVLGNELGYFAREQALLTSETSLQIVDFVFETRSHAAYAGFKLTK